jgi:hypothetical protein
MNILTSCVAGDRAAPEEVVALRAAAASSFAEPSDQKWGSQSSWSSTYA